MGDKPKPQMMFHGSGHIFTTPSATRSDKWHWTVVDEQGHANCTCEGWRNHHKCWHVDNALERCGFNVEAIDFQVNL